MLVNNYIELVSRYLRFEGDRLTDEETAKQLRTVIGERLGTV